VVREEGTQETQEAVGEALSVATSAVTYVEARAALARMRTARRLEARAARAARGVLDDLWLDLLSVPPEDELLAAAADLADKHALRGYDAIQLGSAVSLRRAGDVRLACWDGELRAAAQAEGLAVV
jgi:uncharacterized protein